MVVIEASFRFEGPQFRPGLVRWVAGAAEDHDRGSPLASAEARQPDAFLGLEAEFLRAIAAPRSRDDPADGSRLIRPFSRRSRWPATRRRSPTPAIQRTSTSRRTAAPDLEEHVPLPQERRRDLVRPGHVLGRFDHAAEHRHGRGEGRDRRDAGRGSHLDERRRDVGGPPRMARSWAPCPTAPGPSGSRASAPKPPPVHHVFDPLHPKH